MIKDSFKTVFKFPLIPIGFVLPAIIIMAAYSPMLFSMASMNDTNMYRNISFMLFGMLLYFLVILFIQFVYTPVLFNYTYEAAMKDNVEKGWFKRGLKRNWWKIFVANAMAVVPFFIVYFFLIIGFTMTIIPFAHDMNYVPLIIILVLFFIFIMFWSAFLVIFITAVSAQPNFGDAIKYTFTIGMKNIFKITLAVLCIFVLCALLSGVFMLFNTDILFDYYSNMSANILGTIIYYVVLLIVSGIVTSFMYVYSNKLYIKSRKEYFDKIKNETKAEPQNLEA